jgi:hypothetical protein
MQIHCRSTLERIRLVVPLNKVNNQCFLFISSFQKMQHSSLYVVFGICAIIGIHDLACSDFFPWHRSSD